MRSEFKSKLRAGRGSTVTPTYGRFLREGGVQGRTAQIKRILSLNSNCSGTPTLTHLLVDHVVSQRTLRNRNHPGRHGPRHSPNPPIAPPPLRPAVVVPALHRRNSVRPFEVDVVVVHRDVRQGLLLVLVVVCGLGGRGGEEGGLGRAPDGLLLGAVVEDAGGPRSGLVIHGDCVCLEDVAKAECGVGGGGFGGGEFGE